MGINKKNFYIILLIVLILIFNLALSGCKDESKIEELENRIVELEKELQEKNKIIEEFNENQQEEEEIIEEETELTKEDVILDVINEYINAIKNDDFEKQLDLTDKSAKLLVEYKNEEYKATTKYSSKDENITDIIFRVDEIKGNRAEGWMEFKQEGLDYSIETKGKVILEKINDNWKIIDYKRKGFMLSETIFDIDDISQTKEKVTVTIDRIFFSGSELLIKIIFYNQSEMTISPGFNYSDSAIVGENKVQNSVIGPLEGKCADIYPDSICSDWYLYEWDGELSENYLLYPGEFYVWESDTNTSFKEWMYEPFEIVIHNNS
ncbi:MAG: hypothetical protein ISS28_06025 [Candidatus Cloacimonetes bacterium]|nr:hypothetical protein [Actinomycetota bacterium]MBL7086636.1 hypothetical protein [Candidatus Cloacimonadota bacterium]